MQRELNNCVFILELVGFQYFSLKRLTIKNYKDGPSVYRTLHMAVLLVLITILMVFMIWDDGNDKTEKVTAKNVITYATKNSMNFGLISVLIFTIILSFTSTRHIKQIYFNLSEISRYSQQEFDISIDFKVLRRELLSKLRRFIIFFMLLHGLAIYSRFRLFNDVIPMLFGFFPIFFLIMIVYKIVLYVCLINHQLKFIIILLDEIFSKPPIIYHLIYDLPINKFATSSGVSWKQLLSLRKIYNMIYENGVLTNNSFGITTLMLITCIVTALTATGYEAFVIIVGGLPMNRIPG